MSSSPHPLPAIAWLTRVLKSDLQNLRRPRGGASLAHDADGLFAEPAAENSLEELAALYRPPPPAEPRPGKGPVRKAVNWPVSFPGPHPVSGEQSFLENKP
jgi:hypothetical protein